MNYLQDMFAQAQQGQAIDNLARAYGISSAQAQAAVDAMLPAFQVGIERTTQSQQAMMGLFGTMARNPYAQAFENPAFPMGAQVRDQGNDALAARFGNVVTSGYRPGDDGWHGQNRARDYAGGNMGAFARAMLAYAPSLLELIYTPLGVGVKNGSIVPISFFGSDVMADHFDHVHVAMETGGVVQRGGWAVVGERGPELAHFPGGSTVFDAVQTRGAIGGDGNAGIRVIFEGVPTELQRLIRVQLDEDGRRIDAEFRAGVLR